MSKAVKGIGRAVKKVVSGVKKVVSKVMKNPIGRLLATAAIGFFAAPMLAGAMAGAAGGSGFLGTIGGALSGAASGASAAFSGLTGAIGTAASQGIGAGLSQLSTGMASNFGMGTVGDAFGKLAGSFGGVGETVGNVATGMGNSGGGLIQGAQNIASTVGDAADDVLGAAGSGGGWTSGYDLPMGGATQVAKSPGILDSILGGVKEYKLGPSLVQAGGQLLTGAFQGKALEEQREYEERKRKEELQRMYDSYKINWRVGDDGRYYSA